MPVCHSGRSIPKPLLRHNSFLSSRHCLSRVCVELLQELFTEFCLFCYFRILLYRYANSAEQCRIPCDGIRKNSAEFQNFWKRKFRKKYAPFDEMKGRRGCHRHVSPQLFFMSISMSMTSVSVHVHPSPRPCTCTCPYCSSPCLSLYPRPCSVPCPF